MKLVLNEYLLTSVELLCCVIRCFIEASRSLIDLLLFRINAESDSVTEKTLKCYIRNNVFLYKSFGFKLRSCNLHDNLTTHDQVGPY